MSVFSFRKPGGESETKKLWLVHLSIIFCLLISGVIFGYSGLYKSLVFEAKAFAQYCEVGESLPCPKQHDHLTMMYTMAASTISGSALPVGIFLDAYGPRVTVCIGSIISTLSLLALAYASVIADYFYYIGFVGLAVGGPCISSSMTNFGELFGRNSALVISAQTGAFNSSSLIIFLIGQLISEWGWPFRSVLLVYTVVPISIFFTSLFMFCDEPYKNDSGTGDQGEIHRVWHLRSKLNKATVESAGSEAEDAGLEQPLLGSTADPESSTEPSTVPKNLYNVPFSEQIQSFVFWSMCLVTGFFVLRVNFYISTVSSQMLYEAGILQSPPFSDPSAAFVASQDYVSMFNIIMAVVGVIMVPVLGYVLVHLGLGPAFAIISLTNTAFSAVNLLNWIPLPYQMLSFLFFSMSRPFVFGSMAAYIGRIFGFKNFGKLYGLARISGSLATAMNYPLSRFAEVSCNGNYYWVNLGFLGMEALMFSFPIYLVTHVFSGFVFRPAFE